VLLPQSPIDKLDTPCLLKVLQYVSPQEQVVACSAVCEKWRKATREAITSIDINSSSQQKFDQLQQWLGPATLDKMSLSASCPASVQLQLSVLQHLRELKLDSVRLEAVAADGSVLQLVDLLPRLQQCTMLTLDARGDADLTTAAAALHAMPTLQDLQIKDAGLPESLVALPTTLTHLYLLHDGGINATSAASISQLTGLRVLEVAPNCFDTSKKARGVKQGVSAAFAACIDICFSVGCPCYTPDTRFPYPPAKVVRGCNTTPAMSTKIMDSAIFTY